MREAIARCARCLANQVVRADELYTMKEVQHRLGIGEGAMRTLRKEGFPLIRVGKRAYASGRKVIEFFEKKGETSDAC